MDFNMIFDDHPVFSGDIQNYFLWEKDTQFVSQLATIARQIVRPLVTPGASIGRSLCFAIYGSWGMGKTSAANLIVESCTTMLDAAGSDVRQKFKQFTYLAPLYETSSPASRVSVRETLGTEILAKLLENQDDPLGIMMQMPNAYAGAFDVLGKTHVPPQIEQNNDVYNSLRIHHFAKLAVHELAFEKLLAGLLTGVSPANGQQVCVVVVDDLDRCSTEFAWEVLSTILQFANRISNLYFILPVDRAKLQDAVARSRNSNVADFALEKYIQHFVRVPAMSVSGLERLIAGLSREHGNEAVFNLLSGFSPIIYHGLRARTPRSVKRMLNSLVNRLGPEFDRVADSSNSRLRLLVWEHVLEYSWPNFYAYYDASITRVDDRQFILAPSLIALFSICADYFFDRDGAKFTWELDRLRKRTQREWAEILNGEQIDFDLVSFLGNKEILPSQLDPNSKNETHQGEPSLDLKNVFRTETTQPTDDNIIGQLRTFMTEASIHVSTQNRGALIDIAARAYDLAKRSLDQVGSNPIVASLLGDVAGYLAQLEFYDQACQVFEFCFALPSEPQVKVNNTRRYAATVVIMEDTNRLQNAYERLRELSPDTKEVNQNDMALLARIRTIAQKHQVQIAGLMPIDINESLRALERSPEDRSLYLSGINIAISINDYKAIRQLTRMHLSALPARVDVRYTPLRIMADALAESSDPLDELEAMELYRTMFKRMLCKETQGIEEDRQAIYVNYAVLLYKHDYDDIAGRFIYHAYKLDRNSGITRRFYVRYLGRAKRSDLAERVIKGEEITEMVLIPGNPLPDSFVDQSSIWWMTNDNFGDPCTRAEYPE